MIDRIFEGNVIFNIVVVICGVSVLVRIALLLLYRRLIKAASSPDKEKGNGYSRRFIRRITDKFIYEYEKSYPVNNVSVFVDKYMYEVKLFGIRSSTWETMESVSLILCLVSGTLCAFRAYYHSEQQSELIRYVLEGLLSAGIITVSDALFDLTVLRSQLHTNICDHIENYMKPRLECGEYDSSLIEKARLLDDIDEGMIELMNSLNNIQSGAECEDSGQKEAVIDPSDEDERILEDVIREYLT